MMQQPNLSIRYSLMVAALLANGIAPAWGQTTIPLDELSVPPAELKALLKSGRVAFEYGTSNESSDSNGPPERSRRFAAETHYQIEFDYDAQIGWRILPSGRELRITARLRRFNWQPSHRVWFRDPPAIENFWSNPLVLHEFDHVRLSTDPRMKSRFDELLRKPFVIRHQLTAGEIGNQRLARRLVDEHLQAMHQEVLDLIGIRYQELDRATSHGGTPLGPDSPLYELLRETHEATGEP